MPTAYIGIGLPGSGKTTHLKPFAANKGAVYICPDDIRLEMTGDAADQSRNSEVWSQVFRLIHAALAENRDIVVDATNAKRPERLRMIRHCRVKADRIEGRYYVARIPVCLSRVQARARVVPDYRMGFMAGWLDARPPHKEEGYDKLVKIDTSNM